MSWGIVWSTKLCNLWGCCYSVQFVFQFSSYLIFYVANYWRLKKYFFLVYSKFTFDPSLCEILRSIQIRNQCIHPLCFNLYLYFFLKMCFNELYNPKVCRTVYLHQIVSLKEICMEYEVFHMIFRLFILSYHCSTPSLMNPHAIHFRSMEAFYHKQRLSCLWCS